VRHARLVGPTDQVLVSIPRRGAAGHLPELGRRLRRSPGRGQQGGLVEGGGDGDVRALDGQSQVAGSFLRIVDDRREPRMQLPSPSQGGPLVDGGGEEWVGEPEPVADDLYDAVLGGRTQSIVDRRGSDRLSDRLQRRCRQGRHDLEGFDGPRRKPLETVLDEVLEALRDREPFAGRHVTSTAKERQSDLLCEEGIASRHLVEAEERGSGEPFPHLGPKHSFEGVLRQRFDVDGVHAILGQGRHDTQGVVIGTGASSGSHQTNLLVFQASHDELEHPDRREVHPLDVIDGHHDGRGGGHRSEASKHGEGNGSLIGSGTGSRGAQEGHLEGLALGLRHGGECLLEDGLEEVTEGSVRQARLGLDGTA
jgi:hypothetical protein